MGAVAVVAAASGSGTFLGPAMSRSTGLPHLIV